MMDLDKLLTRLLLNSNPRLEFNKAATVSDILLFKDFMRRSRECKSKNGVKTLPLMSYKNYDFYFKLFEENIENCIPFNEYSLEFRPKFNGWSKVYLFIYLFIYWELLDDNIKIQLQTPINPFESVFKIIQRGVQINYYERAYRFDDLGIRLNVTFNLHSISDDFLNYIDSKCNLEGSSGIPNQERVDELWAEFNEMKTYKP